MGICREAAAVTLPRTTLQPLTLPNGLQAYLVEDHQAPMVNVQVWYHVGSKNEVAGEDRFCPPVRTPDV